VSCLEPDKIDELWPPEVATCHASEELYVKAFSIEAAQIDMKYVRRAHENLSIVMDKLYWHASA
jgi:hypothetical protein